MPDFKIRSNQEELMDDLDYQGEVVDLTLKELHVINTWLGGNHVILSGLQELLDKQPSIPSVLRIADLGCGGGDLLKLIADWAKKKNIKVQLTGIDANPYIVAYAQRNTKDYPEIAYQSINIFDQDFYTQQYDIITCTLFCHHFTEEQLLTLFAKFRHQAALGLVINDIHRHWLAYHSIALLTKFFSRSIMVKNDAKLSVLRAFRKKELKSLFEKAGFSKNNVTWKWAFRFQAVGWR